MSIGVNNLAYFDRTTQIQDELEQIKYQTLLLALPGLFIAALFLGWIVPTLSEYQWALTTAIGLIILVPVTWFLSRKNFILGSLALIGSYFLGVFSVIFWGGITDTLVLLFLPVGLLCLTLGSLAGVVGAIACTILVILAPGKIAQTSEIVRICTVIGVWSIVSILWMTFRPMLSALGWYWESFKQSQEWLTQARDYQVQLHQALDELTYANTQLKRLNTVANDLRQIADEERKTKEQFVANVSHELRTPLNMIIGFCELILRNPGSYGKKIPGKLLADLQVVLRNSQQLSSLIDDVLDLSQIEAGQMALVREWVHIPDIIEAVLIAVRPLFETKNLYLEANIPDELPVAYCDRTRIREVLLNLLSNAGRFTETGGVTLSVWQEANHLYFSVRDTGPGIAEIDREKLFQPFQQLDASIRRKHGGTGLGLSISKSFVELHDGKMTVESEIGRGTVFTFYFPVEPHILAQPGYTRWMNPYDPYEKPIRRSRQPLIDSRPKILVIEKGKVLQRFLNRYLPNVEVAAVANLSLAQADMEKSASRIVVINDSKIEKVLTELSTTRMFPLDTPVMICSARDNIQDAQSKDIIDVLIKPITSDILIGSLEKLGDPIQTILIVDDEPEIQNLYLRIFISANPEYQVLRADNGKQALSLLERKKVDVIYLDLVMPEMDGYEFLEIKAQNTAICDIPVILISARDPEVSPEIQNFLAVTKNGGLSYQQILNGIQALGTILVPGGLGDQQNETDGQSGALTG